MSRRSLCQLQRQRQRRWDSTPRIPVDPPKTPKDVSTHRHFAGEEAEVLSFMGGPPGSSRPIAGLACPPCTSTPLATQTARPRRAGSCPCPGPSCRGRDLAFILSTQVSAFASAAPSVWKPLCAEHTGSGFSPACLASQPCSFGPKLWSPPRTFACWDQQGPGSVPPRAVPRLPLQSGWPGVFGVPLSGPSRLPSTWPPGGSRLLTRKTAPGLVTR